MDSSFKVIEASSFSELTQKVQAALSEGWALHGEMHLHTMGMVQAMKMESPEMQPVPSVETADALQALRHYSKQDYSIQSAMVPMMRLMLTTKTPRGPKTVAVSEFVSPDAISHTINARDD